MIVNLEAGSGSSSPRNILDSGTFGRGIGFTAFTTTGGTELYTTTGAVGNFDLVDQIEAGSGSSSPFEFHYSGLVAIFSAQTAAAGFEPWLIVDVAGSYFTTSLGNLNPGAAHSLPKEFTPAAGATFFTADDGTSGRELWTTGGSAATTDRLKDIFPGLGGSEPAELLAFDGRLFFRACDATAGCELWTSDGTLGGTQRFKDILPGTGSGNPQHLVVVGDDLYFSACDEAFGCELWVSDGSCGAHPPPRRHRAGAGLLESGSGSLGEPADPLVAVGSRLFFSATDGSGRELWAMPLFLFDDGFESNDTTAWSLTAP